MINEIKLLVHSCNESFTSFSFSFLDRISLVKSAYPRVKFFPPWTVAVKKSLFISVSLSLFGRSVFRRLDCGLLSSNLSETWLGADSEVLIVSLFIALSPQQFPFQSRFSALQKVK